VNKATSPKKAAPAKKTATQVTSKGKASKAATTRVSATKSPAKAKAAPAGKSSAKAAMAKGEGENPMQELRQLIGEIQDLRSTQGLLGWDLEVFMPEKGSTVRAQQLGTLAKLTHEMMVSERMGQLLTTLRAPGLNKTLSSVDRAIVREVGRDYDRQVKLPTELVQEMTRTTAEAMPIWAEARKNSDFKAFAPTLQKIIDLNIQMAKAIGYKDSPYDALLDLYEPDLSVAQLDPLFAQLKKDLVPLVQAIAASTRPPEDKFLFKKFNTDKQMAFSREVLEAMGFDFQAGRLDLSVHPFTMGTSPNDVRLTTRVFEDNLFSCLASSMHEGGHGMYEQGVNPALARTSLDGGTSLGIHESQSRMWENVVGRSLPFWKHFFPKLKKLFPKKLADINLNDFYRAINVVAPSPIRVEADEVTYNLHIILRYEIEKDLIEGRLAVKDLPTAWNRKMKEYLGYMPKNDAEGCLQDVHWSHGSFGYFPTYTLGNLYSVQFYNAAKKAIPTLEDAIASGNLRGLKKWLNDQIHFVSRMERPDEIVRRVTGGPLNAQPFVDYLWEKYTPIYGLKRLPAAKPLTKTSSARATAKKRH
jgi:carboxypeptidase Taq